MTKPKKRLEGVITSTPKRSKELEEILIRFYTLMFQAEESPMTLNSWGKKCVNEAITAIEKWAKEKYGRS